MKKILKVQLLLAFIASQLTAFGQDESPPSFVYQANRAIESIVAFKTKKIIECESKKINDDWLIGCPIGDSIALFEVIKNPHMRGYTYWAYTVNGKAEQIVGAMTGSTSRIKGKSENKNIDIPYAVSQFQ